MYVLIALLTTAPLSASAQAPATEEVTVARVWSRADVEEATLRLVTDEGLATVEAHEAISILARPQGTPRPTDDELRAYREANPESRRLTDEIPLVHPGLIQRLSAIADRFPGRRIDIVSGFRPRARRTSRHRRARALDIRVVGISKRRVTEFARTLPETGVGYYPNSLFTHIDVRQDSHYWVDRSGPGEPADYGPWPPTDADGERVRVAALASGPGGSGSDAPESESDFEPEPEPEPTAAPEPGPEDAFASAEAPAPARPSLDEAPRAPVAVATAEAPRPAATPSGPSGIDWTPPFPSVDDPAPSGGAPAIAGSTPDEPPLTPSEIEALRAQIRADLARLRD